MKFTKPINISYESMTYLFFLSIALYVSWNHIFDENIINNLWDYGIWGLPIALLFSITIRALRINETRLTTSALLFGFIVGIVFWTLFSLSEMRSEGQSFKIGVVIGILVFGCFTAFVAWIIAIILSKLIIRICR